MADKIAELITPRPLMDPEIDLEDETAAKTHEYDVDEDNEDDQAISQLSDIRKKNVKLLQDVDAKYRGKVSSRKDFDSDSEELENISEAEENNQSDRDSAPPENGQSFSMRLKPMMDADEDDIGSDGSGTEDDDAIQEFSMKLNGSAQKASESDDEVDMGSDNEPLETWDDGEEDDEEIDNSEGEEVESDEEDDEEDDEEEEESNGEEDEDESDFGGGDIIATESTEERPAPVSILPKKQTENHQQKGVSVQNQLQIWEKLLEVRIHSQKMLIKSNSLPNYAKFHKMTEDSEDFSNLANETLTNVTDLLSKMRQLQTALLKQYPETREFAQKRKSSTNGPETVEAKRGRIGSELSDDFDRFKDYQNSVITKWHDRTKVLTPGSVKSQQMHGNLDIMRKIEGALANRDDLVRKSQLFKGGYQLFDQPATASNDDATTTAIENDAPTPDAIYSTEIYDDSDFYHTQLRELIEYKTNTSSNSNDMAKQFAELQKLRKKMKKAVDTRASKGRKIRYVVHNKLVSFMAPNANTTWTNESKNELFRSLFGAQTWAQHNIQESFLAFWN